LVVGTANSSSHMLCIGLLTKVPTPKNLGTSNRLLLKTYY